MAEPSFFSFSYGRRACPKKTLAKGEGPHPLSFLRHWLHRCSASRADDGLELNAGLGCVSASAAVTGREVVEGDRVVAWIGSSTILENRRSCFVLRCFTFANDSPARAILLSGHRWHEIH